MGRPIGRRNLNFARPNVRCRCGKVFGLNLNDAKKMRRRMAEINGNNNPVRYYQCSYGGWHWTSQLTIPEGVRDAARPSD